MLSMLRFVLILCNLCLFANALKKKHELELPVSAASNFNDKSDSFPCPSGYKLDESKCEGHSSLNNKEDCAGSSVRCMITAAPMIQCPPGFQPPNERHHNFVDQPACSAVEIVSMISDCPPNSFGNNGVCLIKREVPLQHVCPIIDRKHHQSHHVGGEEEDCVELDAVPAEPFCENGVFEGEVCAGIKLVPCPPSPKKVHLPAVPPPKKAAISPVHGKEESLLSRMLAKGVKKIPETVEMELCEIPVSVGPSFRCPAGSVESTAKHGGGSGGSGGKKPKLQCVVPRAIPLQPVCPFPDAQISPDGASCFIVTPVESLASCPPDYAECTKRGIHHFSGRCCKVEVAPPFYICPPAFELMNGTCVAYIPPIYN